MAGPRYRSATPALLLLLLLLLAVFSLTASAWKLNFNKKSSDGKKEKSLNGSSKGSKVKRAIATEEVIVEESAPYIYERILEGTPEHLVETPVLAGKLKERASAAGDGRKKAHKKVLQEVSVDSDGSMHSVDRGLADNGRVKVNIAQGPGTNMLPIAEREKQLNGLEIDGVLVFQILWKLDFKNDVQSYLDAGYNVVLCLELVDVFPNLQETGGGRYDKELLAFAEDLVADGRVVTLRPMHEFNGNWYCWGTYFGGTNSPEMFIRAWKHIVDLFQSVNAPVLFQLNYNVNNYGNDPAPFSQWYPGDEYVDMVSISGYNRAGADPYHNDWESLQDVIGDAYYQISSFTDKPIGVGETSTTSYLGGNKPEWFRDAFKQITWNLPRIVEVNFFFFQEGKQGDWDLNTPDEIQGFIDGVNYVREFAKTPYGPDPAPRTMAPTQPPPTPEPTVAVTDAPTAAPTAAPTVVETPAPTAEPEQPVKPVTDPPVLVEPQGSSGAYAQHTHSIVLGMCIVLLGFVGVHM